MSQVVIGQFYKKEKDAAARAVQLEGMWNGKIRYFVLCLKEGYMVIGESQARTLRPDLFEKSRYPRYSKRNPDELMEIIN